MCAKNQGILRCSRQSSAGELGVAERGCAKTAAVERDVAEESHGGRCEAGGAPSEAHAAATQQRHEREAWGIALAIVREYWGPHPSDWIDGHGHAWPPDVADAVRDHRDARLSSTSTIDAY